MEIWSLNDMEIIHASFNELDVIMEMIDKGRKHIQTYHIDQWINGYPSIDVIKEDINTNRGYLLVNNNEILAYYALLEHDECYDYIEGEWLNNETYVAIHRVVTKDFNSGLGSKLFDELKKRYSHIRIDTHDGNISMNKCLIKNKFKYCGIIYLKDRSKRNAYEFVR